MERVRPPRSETSSEESLQPLPRRPSLPALVERLELSGTPEEVDALIRGLARPLEEGESPRQRADLLLSLIESPDKSTLRGTHGRGVGDAAVKALMNLGYPYALEVPPEALASFRASTGRNKQRVVPVAGIVISLFTLVLQGLVSVPLSLYYLYSDKLLWTFLITAGLLVPIPTALLGGWLRKPTAQSVGLKAMWAVAVGWLITALVFGKGVPIALVLIPLLLSLGSVLGAWLMRHPQWMVAEEPPEPSDSRPSPSP
jgi:hypothetical protein